MTIFHKLIQSNRNRLLVAFLAKILASCAFYYIYTFYYSETRTSDVYKYFYDARDILEGVKGTDQYFRILTGMQRDEDDIILQKANFWYTAEETTIINDNRSLIRFNLLLLPFSRGAIIWHFLVIALLSFSGMQAAFKALIQRGSGLTTAFLSCFFIPSVLFWSSGVIKEGLLIFTLGWFLNFALNSLAKFSWIKCFCLLICLIMTLFIKFYIFPALCLFLLLLIPLELLEKPRINGRKAILIFLFPVISITTCGMHFYPDLPTTIFEKQRAFINLGKGGHFLKNLNSGDTLYVPYEFSPYRSEQYWKIPSGSKVFHWKHLCQDKEVLAQEQNVDSIKLLLSIKPSGSYYVITPVNPSWMGLLKATPGAIFNALARPFPSDIKSLPEWISFFEILAIACFLIVRLLKRDSIKNTDWPFLLSAILFAAFVLFISGLTTPVAGALVRYRMPALWFFCMAMFAQNKKADP
jgi:hypothetical protein